MAHHALLKKKHSPLLLQMQFELFIICCGFTAFDQFSIIPFNASGTQFMSASCEQNRGLCVHFFLLDDDYFISTTTKKNKKSNTELGLHIIVTTKQHKKKVIMVR